jgi:hypothetical protein
VLNVSAASVATSLCVECNFRKSTCLGGSHISPRPGYWTMTVNATGRRDFDSSVSAGGESASNQGSIVSIVPCDPAKRCLEGGKCAKGMQGPICGLCQERYGMQSGGLCIPCPKTLSAVYQIAGGILVFSVFCIAYYYSLLQPLFQDENAPETGQERGQSVFRCMSAAYEALNLQWFLNLPVVKVLLMPFEFIREQLVLLFAAYLRNSGPEVIKVMISFMQVAGTFLSDYSVKWPSFLTNFFTVALTFTVRLKSLPGQLGCVFTSMSFVQMQWAYLLIPIGLLLIMSLPACYVSVHGREHPKYEDVMQRFSLSCTFMLFIMYPMLSSPSLEFLSCVDIGGGELRSKVSLNEPCFRQHQSSLQFVLGVMMILLFPIGILVIFFALLQVN